MPTGILTRWMPTNGMSFVGSALGRGFGNEFIDDETGGDADDAG